MPSHIKLLTTRRGYEFDADELRLDVLALPHNQQVVKEEFGFQANGIASPPPLFGSVPQSVPAGLIFLTGAFAGDEARVPIHTLAIEPRRVVLDMLASPETIDLAFERLRLVTDGMAPGDLGPTIGEPRRARDYSEMSVRFDFDAERLLAPGLGPLLKRAVSSLSTTENDALLPTLSLQLLAPDQEYPGPTTSAAVLAPRAFTEPSDRVYYSAAFLTPEEHSEYLNAIIGLLSALD